MIRILDAPPAPRGLLFVATFSRHDREAITRHPELMRAMHKAEPGAWAGIMAAHRRAQRVALETRIVRLGPDDDGMRRQALNDLQTGADALAALTDTRRGQLFGTACRLAKYVAHRVLSEAETYAALREAAAANGSLTRYGRHWADSTIRRALIAGRNDLLPVVAHRFRTNGDRP
jgi:hypothetical protein